MTENGTSVVFVPGSVTPFEMADPRVRLYQYNKEYPFTMLDYQSFRLDLLESNLVRGNIFIFVNFS